MKMNYSYRIQISHFVMLHIEYEWKENIDLYEVFLYIGIKAQIPMNVLELQISLTQQFQSKIQND